MYILYIVYIRQRSFFFFFFKSGIILYNSYISSCGRGVIVGSSLNEENGNATRKAKGFVCVEVGYNITGRKRP